MSKEGGDPKQHDARQAPEVQLYLGMDEKFPNHRVIIDDLLLWLEFAFVLSVRALLHTISFPCGLQVLMQKCRNLPSLLQKDMTL